MNMIRGDTSRVNWSINWSDSRDERSSSRNIIDVDLMSYEKRSSANKSCSNQCQMYQRKTIDNFVMNTWPVRTQIPQFRSDDVHKTKDYALICVIWEGLENWEGQYHFRLEDSEPNKYPFSLCNNDIDINYQGRKGSRKSNEHKDSIVLSTQFSSSQEQIHLYLPTWATENFLSRHSWAIQVPLRNRSQLKMLATPPFTVTTFLPFYAPIGKERQKQFENVWKQNALVRKRIGLVSSGSMKAMKKLR